MVGLTAEMKYQSAELERMGEKWKEHPAWKSICKLSRMGSCLPQWPQSRYMKRRK